MTVINVSSEYVLLFVVEQSRDEYIHTFVTTKLIVCRCLSVYVIVYNAIYVCVWLLCDYSAVKHYFYHEEDIDLTRRQRNKIRNNLVSDKLAQFSEIIFVSYMDEKLWRHDLVACVLCIVAWWRHRL